MGGGENFFRWGGDLTPGWEEGGKGGVLKQTNTETSEIVEQVRISSFRTCSESGNSVEISREFLTSGGNTYTRGKIAKGGEIYTEIRR